MRHNYENQSPSTSSFQAATGYRLERIQLDGFSLWSVDYHGNVLNKDGEWEYEPQPSSRDAEFLKRCRFGSPQEALEAFNNRKVAYE